MHRSNTTPRMLRALAATLVSVLCSADLRSASTSIPTLQPIQAGASDAESAAAVEKVLTSAEHPALRWSAIADVAATLKPLYEAEPDRLLWFAGPAPAQGLKATLATIALAGDYGLDATDYDAALLAERWAALEAGKASGPERAHFDLAVSVAVARMMKAVRVGRVDPATMHWGYEVTSKEVDVTGPIRDVRERPHIGGCSRRPRATVRALRASTPDARRIPPDGQRRRAAACSQPAERHVQDRARQAMAGHRTSRGASPPVRRSACQGSAGA